MTKIHNPWTAPRNNSSTGRLLIEAYMADKLGKNYAPNPAGRYPVVHVQFTPDPGQGIKRPYDKTGEMWYEFWDKTMEPSLMDLELNISDLAPNGEAWVVRAECEFRKTGSTYTSGEGEVKSRHELAMLSILDDERPEQRAPAQSSADRAAMAQFLPSLWKQADENTAKFYALIAANPLTAALFDPSSAEVVAIAGAYLEDDIPF